MIDLSPRYLSTVLDLLREHVPDCDVRAFGSRVTWTANEHSDLDLTICGTTPLSPLVLQRLKEAFDESDLPIRVDLLDWHRLSKKFRALVHQSSEVLYRGVSADNRKRSAKQPAFDTNWIYRPTFRADWPHHSLYTLAQWTNGLPFGKIQFSETGLPVIKITEIKNGISRQTKFTTKRFDESVLVRQDDLLFSWSGQPETSIDAVRWRGRDGWLNQHIFKVTPGTYVDSNFFYYLLKYLRPNFIAIARNKQTTGLGHVTKSDLQTIEVGIPPIDQQQRISTVLNALDMRIDFSRDIDKTLRSIATTLFKSWFIKFDPVRAKMQGRNPTLPKRLADLFPNRLVHSDIGEIPQDWRVCSLGEIVETIPGRSYRSRELSESQTALVTLKSFARGGGYRSEGLKPYVGRYRPQQVLQSGEIILACTDVAQAAEVIGRPAIVLPSSIFHTLVASLDVMILRPTHDGMTRAFLYLLTSTKSFVAHTTSYTTGTTVLHLDKAAVPSYRLALPPTELIKSFDDIAKPILAQMQRNQRDIEILTALRDALLPRLVSGSLPVASIPIRRFASQ